MCIVSSLMRTDLGDVKVEKVDGYTISDER